MNNFEIVKTETGYLMYVDGGYVEVPEEALVMNYAERELHYDMERVDLKVTGTPEEPEEA